MGFPIIPELLKQLGRKPATNAFPAPHLPPSVTEFLADVAAGRTELIAPVPTPVRFRGKIAFDSEKCNGCGLCLSVCPAHAIERSGPGKRDKMMVYVAQCCSCEQCTAVCARGALTMTDEFLTATYDRYSEDLVLK